MGQGSKGGLGIPATHVHLNLVRIEYRFGRHRRVLGHALRGEGN